MPTMTIFALRQTGPDYCDAGYVPAIIERINRLAEINGHTDDYRWLAREAIEAGISMHVAFDQSTVEIEE